MIIKINNQEWELNVEEAKKANVLKPAPIKNVSSGDVFTFSSKTVLSFVATKRWGGGWDIFGNNNAFEAFSNKYSTLEELLDYINSYEGVCVGNIWGKIKGMLE